MSMLEQAQVALAKYVARYDDVDYGPDETLLAQLSAEIAQAEAFQRIASALEQLVGVMEVSGESTDEEDVSLMDYKYRKAQALAYIRAERGE